MSDEKLIYKADNITIGANSITEISVDVRYFQILENSADDIKVSFNNQPEMALESGISVQAPNNQRIRTVRFNNDTAGAITLKYGIGEEAFFDNRLILAAGTPLTTRSGNTVAASKDTVGTSSATLLAANSDRTRATIRNNSTSDVIYIAESGTATTNDFPIKGGEALTIESGAEITAIGSAASIDVRIFEERS